MKYEVTLHPLDRIMRDCGTDMSFLMEGPKVTYINDERVNNAITDDMIREYWVSKNGQFIIDDDDKKHLKSGVLFRHNIFNFYSLWVDKVEPIAPETYLITLGSRVYEVDANTDGNVFRILKSYQRK